MKWKTFACIFFVTAFVVAAFAQKNLAQENNDVKGAEKMELNAGSKAKVPFPHKMHQEKLGDCNACHALFPRKQGAIDELKAQEKLKKKQVMNTVCIKCHKAEKDAGKKAGPTSCSVCHSK